MKRVMQFLWVFPATVLTWLFYILPMHVIFRDLVFCGWAEPLVAEFKLAKENLEPWYAKLWRDWGGWGGPCVFIRRDVSDPAVLTRVRKHELEHVHQQFRWGIFFYPAYLLASIWIWCFGGENKHSYYDNPFEIAARKAALQPIKIGPEQWKDGPDDRWAWW